MKKLSQDELKELFEKYQRDYGSIEAQTTLQIELDLAVEEYEEIGDFINKMKKAYEQRYADVSNKFLEKKLQVSVLKIMVAGDKDISSIKEQIRNLEHRKDFLSEEINRLKLKIRINEAQISREWYQSGNSK